MTSETISLDALQKRTFPALTTVCSFGPCTVFSALGNRQYWLIVLNTPALEAIVCAYDNVYEWRSEMATLERAAHNNDSNGPPDIGVTANLPPSPPAAPASNTRVLSALKEAVLPS